MNQQQRLQHDELIKTLTDSGKLMAAGFRALQISVIPPDTPKVQVDQMRLAYMVGAQHLYASMMAIFDAGHEPTDSDMRRMASIDTELRAFEQEWAAHMANSGTKQ